MDSFTQQTTPHHDPVSSDLHGFILSEPLSAFPKGKDLFVLAQYGTSVHLAYSYFIEITSSKKPS